MQFCIRSVSTDTTTMYIIRSLCGVFALLFIGAGCETIETRIAISQMPASTVEINYERDTEAESEEVDNADETATESLSVTQRGKIVIGYMNNERELYAPNSYTVTFWKMESAVQISDLTNPLIFRPLVAGKKPFTKAVKKDNKRSHTRKTLPVGIYIAHVVDSDMYLQFTITAGSDGLLCFNENRQHPLFYGYYPSYGKFKVSLWNGPAKVEDAHVTLSKDIAPQGEPTVWSDLETWLYAEDGTGSRKGLIWYMPSGSYAVSHWANKKGGSGSYPVASAGQVTIQPGKVYPHVKIKYL